MLRERILHLWNTGALDDDALINSFREDLQEVLPAQVVVLAKQDHFDALRAALIRARARRRTFTTPLDFLRYARDRVLRSYEVAGRPKIPPLQLSKGKSDGLTFVAHLAQDPPATTLPTDTRPVRDLDDLNMSSLGALAALPDDLPLNIRPMARLLTLRLFAGWSLEQIAQHDNQATDAVDQMWRSAKDWLISQTPPSASVGRVVTLDDVQDDVVRAIKAEPRLLHFVSWRSFETVIARILEKLGYEIELQRGTKDGGIDVIAIRHDDVFGQHRYLLQAKRWSNRVGVGPVRELLYLKTEWAATKACLATTSMFTRGARELEAEHRWELQLRDFEALQEWLKLLRE